MAGVDKLDLTHEQQRVLLGIYSRLVEHAKWPVFAVLDRILARQEVDAAKTLSMMPPGLILGVTRGSRVPPTDNTQISLTLLGFAWCEARWNADSMSEQRRDVEIFLETLRWLADAEISYVPPEGEPLATVTLPINDISWPLVGLWDTAAAQRVRRLFESEHCGVSVSGQDDEWFVHVDRNARRFGAVWSVEDYTTVKAAWRKEAEGVTYSHATGGVTVGNVYVGGAVHAVSSEVAAARKPRDYVRPEVVEALTAAVATSQFDCTKLLTLIAELNANYREGRAYGSFALLRAILDHVPPILGHKNFDQVASNYRWTATDRQYMKQLVQARDQGDDALHRHISKRRDLLDIHDFPPSIRLNNLLQECAIKLGES